MPSCAPPSSAAAAPAASTPRPRALWEIFRSQYARRRPAVEDAFGRQLPAAQAAGCRCQAADDLITAAEAAFKEHADSEVLLSFPGLGLLLGARLLAEIGDERTRFAYARVLKSYAGSAPITRPSGKKHFVGRRFVKNNRLMHAGFLWAFSSLIVSPGVNAHYRRRREHGDWHNAAQRHLLNRFLGQLHHCLQIRQSFGRKRSNDSDTASRLGGPCRLRSARTAPSFPQRRQRRSLTEERHLGHCDVCADAVCPSGMAPPPRRIPRHVDSHLHDDFGLNQVHVQGALRPPPALDVQPCQGCPATGGVSPRPGRGRLLETAWCCGRCFAGARRGRSGSVGPCVERTGSR